MLLDNALATMGAGLPSAIAAKLFNPSGPCGAVRRRRLHDERQELETAVRLKLDLVVVIVRDFAYGMIRGSRRPTVSPISA